MAIRKILRDWFTGIDGETYDLGRGIWATAITGPIAIAFVQVTGSIISLWRPVPLPLWGSQDWTAWAAGTGGMMVAGAGSLYMKRGTEPNTITNRTVVAAATPAVGSSIAETAVESSAG